MPQFKPEQLIRRMCAAVVILLSAIGVSCSNLPPSEVTGTCTETANAAGWLPPQAQSAQSELDFDELIARLAGTKVTLIGEYHQRYDNHLTQLEVLCRLHRKTPDIALGVEFVQRPFQPVMDAFIVGEIDERDLLESTEYFTRWGYDYRVYAPLLQFARDNQIPVVALNAATELTTKAGHAGLDALTDNERSGIARDIEPAGEAYRERLKAIFDQHPGSPHQDLERFTLIQLLWDETMAESAAHYLLENPGRRMLVIAGNGHVGFLDAMPNRIERRIDGEVIAIAQEIRGRSTGADAHYTLHSQDLELPPAGLLGVMLDVTETAIKVQSVIPDSGALEAGIQPGDLLRAINGNKVPTFEHVRLEMWNQRVGAVVTVEIERDGVRHHLPVRLR